MQEIICHIGFPKTGTTFLQKKVFPNIKNVNYLAGGKIKQLLHDVVQKDDSFYNKFKTRAQLIQLHNSNLNMLFSNEQLTGHHIKTEFPNRTQIARRLKAAGVNKIIITIRNQSDVLESSYKQYIKSGGVLKISKFFDLNNNLNPILYIDYFNYVKIIELYSEIFGLENVKILQFEDIFSKNTTFYNQLASFLKVENIDFKNSPELKVNKSLSNFSTKLLRVINHFTYHSYSPSSLISKKLSSVFFYKTLRLINSPKNEKKLISKYENEIYSHFLGSNSLLKERYNINLHEKYFALKK